MNNRAEGLQSETLACNYLQSIGYKIIERNFSCALGEIDIIALDGSSIVFAEVKSRMSDKYGIGAEAVTAAKMRKIARTAQFYIQRKGLYGRDARFDVLSIMRDEITHIPGAFDLSDAGL